MTHILTGEMITDIDTFSLNKENQVILKNLKLNL